jgi:hypothetical protein
MDPKSYLYLAEDEPLYLKEGKYDQYHNLESAEEV